MATPEGRIKRKVNERLAAYPAIWRFMPVQNGMGSPGLDYFLCVPSNDGHTGEFVVIETKAPGKKPTPRQEATMAAISRAGGKVFVVDGEVSLDHAMQYIHMIYEP